MVDDGKAIPYKSPLLRSPILTEIVRSNAQELTYSLVELATPTS
jgi:hypothetical protein